MKIMINKRSRREFAVVVLSVLAAFEIVAETDRIPGIGEIASNILKATLFIKPYRVDVTQTLEGKLSDGAPLKTRSMALPPNSPGSQSTFTLSYIPEKGFRTEVGSLSMIRTASGGASIAAPEGRLSINIPNFLKKIQTWPTNSVDRDTLDGKPLLRVSASTAGAKAVFWVDPESHCVSKVLAEIGGRRFAESTFSYIRDQQHGWLLKTADTAYAADGARVLLEYGPYDFSAK